MTVVLSRVIFHLARPPAPEPQFSVFTPDGRFVSRSDFRWPDCWLVIRWMQDLMRPDP